MFKAPRSDNNVTIRFLIRKCQNSGLCKFNFLYKLLNNMIDCLELKQNIYFKIILVNCFSCS